MVSKIGFIIFSLLYTLGGALILPSISGDIIVDDSVITPPPPPDGLLDSFFYAIENIGFLFMAGQVSTSIAVFDTLFLIIVIVNVYIVISALLGSG